MNTSHTTIHTKISPKPSDLPSSGHLLQRAAIHASTPEEAPSVVHDVLRSPGQPLDGQTRAFMEPRFGHDFTMVQALAEPAPMPARLTIGQPRDQFEHEADIVAEQITHMPAPQSDGRYDFSAVRIHTGTQAAEAARLINAHAFTVGNHIVVDQGQYPPHTRAGRHLLAHELTHVIQQASGVSVGALQRQRNPRPVPVDANAQRIIDLAHDASQPVDRRAVAVVQAIISQYFPNDASKITRIVYREGERGLHITYSGRGPGITGIVEVGRYFVENTTQAHFARRVSQVRHEIEHVEQQRAGMSGQSRQDEREFTAFYHEALFQEPAGAGRMQHSTRVSLIDAALGYFNCLSPGLQQANIARRDELATRRVEAVRRSGRSNLGSAPTDCRRQPD